MKHVPLLALIGTTGLALGSVGVALATRNTGTNDAVQDLARAKVGLVQAIDAAQTATRGRATAAELDGEHGRLVYMVEVVNAKQQVLEVSVDAANGQVLAQRADEAEGEDHEDRD